MEYAEGLVDCAMREVKEETDLDVIAFKSGLSTNDVFVREVKHYITMFVLCKMENRDAVATVSVGCKIIKKKNILLTLLQVMEPEKCECWEWWRPEKLFSGKETGVVEETGEDGDVKRYELFLPLKNLLKEFDTVDDLKRAFQ